MLALICKCNFATLRNIFHRGRFVSLFLALGEENVTDAGTFAISFSTYSKSRKVEKLTRKVFELNCGIKAAL